MNARVPAQCGEVLLVTSSYPRWSGDAVSPFVHHLAQDLRALGWDVRVSAPHAPGAARDEILDGVPVHRFRYFWPESLQTVCYDGGALVKLRRNPWIYGLIPFLVAAQCCSIIMRMLRGNVALVHSHWLLPQGLTATIAARICRLPHVTTAHGSDVFALRGRVARISKRFVLRRANVVTVNSSATQAAVSALVANTRDLIRIPMGATVHPEVDVAEVASLRNRFHRGNGPLLLFVGRLVAEKGAGDLLEAVRLLESEMPDVSALVVGDGPDRERLELQARQLGIAPRIEFRGWLSQGQVQQHLKAADIFVGPSRPGADGTLEAQGLTLIEAMLAGLPVISTAIGGITDAVRNDSTGLTVRAGAPAEIALAIRRLAGDSALAARLVAAARELALQEFTRETCAQRFSAIYARLLSDSTRRNR